MSFDGHPRDTRCERPPGEAFYHDRGGENLLRFCYAKEDAELEEACRRLVRTADGRR